jgi:uncharacterized protein (DUF433 family)
MKKWTLMLGMVMGALVVAVAAFAAAPLSALAQSEAAPAAANRLVETLQGVFSGVNHGRGGADGLVSAAASVTGLTTQEVVAELQADKSLAQIATENGHTADEVIAAARTALVTRLAQAVTDGDLTQAQSDAKLAEFDANAPTLVNSTTLRVGRGFGPGFGGRHGGGAEGLVSAAASVTGLTTQEVITQLQAGQSLAQIAQANGKTAEDVIAAARTTVEAQLAAAVTAGQMTQAQADARLAVFEADAASLVNSTTLGIGRGFGGGRGPDSSRGHGGKGAEGLVSATASVTGLTTQEVVTELQAGQSLAQIAQDNGHTADEVIAAARTALVTQLAAAVTAGQITQAQSDAKLAAFAANAATIVNDTTLGQHRHGGPRFDDGIDAPAPTGVIF